MAESIVQVTEGVGKKLHTFQRTIGANNVEDEVVIAGEPYLATYAVVTTGQSGATANAHVLQIMAGASLKVRLRRITVSVQRLATAAAMTEWALFRLTSAGTGGGVVTPSAYDPADAASGATAMTAPTVKGTEGAALWAGVAYSMQTAAASAEYAQPIIDLDFDRLRSKPPIIAAGAANGLALKLITATANLLIDVVAVVDESSF